MGIWPFGEHPMRAAIYARYSSDRRARGLDRGPGPPVPGAASSARAATLVGDVRGPRGERPEPLAARVPAAAGGRPGRPVRRRLAEALDRLSRDQEDVAALFKALRFAGVRLVTLAEGEISELHVGLKGTMNALFLKDLAAKTHRGLRGRVEQGRSAGGKAYGYRSSSENSMRDGEPVRGGREIDAERGRRSCGGSSRSSPPALAARHRQAPQRRGYRRGRMAGRGRTRPSAAMPGAAPASCATSSMSAGWCGTASASSRTRRPASAGRARTRRAQWIVEDVPELRIVDEDLWARVAARLGRHRRLAGRAKLSRGRLLGEAPAQAHPDRPRRLRLLRPSARGGRARTTCAARGRTATASARTRRAFAAPRAGGDRHRRLQHNLMQPDLVAEFIAAFHAEVNRSRGEAEHERRRHEKRLAEVEQQLDGLITAIAEGLRSPGLQARLDALETREGRRSSATLAAPAPSPVRLHPNLAELYRQKVAALHEALHREETRAEALEILRGLIEQVVVQPARGRRLRGRAGRRDRGDGGGRDGSAAGPNAKTPPREGRRLMTGRGVR